MKKIFFVFVLILCTKNIFADSPFQGYSYNHWGRLVPAPAAYAPSRTFVAGDICETLGEFNNPSAIHVAPDETIFVVDKNNNRIVGFDRELNLRIVIEKFIRNGKEDSLNLPNSVFVTPNGDLYIADTSNRRVVILDADGNFLREITAPVVDGLEDNFAFLPMHVVVGRSGRVLVIVARVYEGIMSFDPHGNFIGYFGTIPVNASPIEVLWRYFMTQEQRAVQMRFIPTEFQSMALDEFGFVFTTNLQPWASDDQVMRLNPRGEDVIVNFNEEVGINGDQHFHPTGAELAGPSRFEDIIARSHGKFSTLDVTRGRVYTYDSEGNMLYVFSGRVSGGTLHGMSDRPVAIESIGEDIMILDAGRGRILYFEPTEYGRLINSAIAARFRGDEDEAVSFWRELVQLDENYIMAWSGIGRAFLAAGENEEAMYYLQRGMDFHHYSIAFRRHRIDVLHNALPKVLTGTVIILILFFLTKFLKSSRGLRPRTPTNFFEKKFDKKL
ncbi:MAG: gluconolactonase [Defluviitaleaceae bacterium]|nr:gluconolactonase [Defluviitaleaceae bacterium]